ALRDEFLRIWTQFRLEETSGELATFDDLYAWATPRTGHLQGKHPSDVKAFAQDGSRAVLLDLSMLLFDDEDQLAALSQRFGEALAFVTQGTSGFAGFRLFERGKLRREILGEDGNVTTVGPAIAAEQGMDVRRGFYLNEVYALQRALGFSFDFTDRIPG